MAATTSKVTLEGKGPVTLRPSDHIATGGEGSIYKIGDCAVKMYLDPLRMRQLGLPEKIKRLAKLVHPFVVAPRGLVLDERSEVVGHYLPFVSGGQALSIVFTKTFWDAQPFDFGKASELVDGMRQVFHHAHQNSVNLVDANELNWFAVVDNKVEPRVIDVDSWVFENDVPPSVPKMPSIRDWHGKVVSRESDWFAFAVVSFQVYSGIHPYKGTLAGFERSDLVGRMKARASVFAPGVRLNAVVRDLTKIPGALLKWYEAVFQGDERSIPPSPYDRSISAAPAARVARTIVLAAGGQLSHELIFSMINPVIRTFSCGVVQTADGTLWDLGSKRALGSRSKKCEVVRVDRGWLVGDGNSFFHVSENDATTTPLSIPVQAHRIFTSGNRMFAVIDRGLVEIKVKIFQQPIGSFGQQWGVMVNSTRWFDGLGVLDALGAMHLILPFGEDKVSTVRVKELDGMKVVAGKAGNRFASIIAVDRAGDYHKIELTFDKEYALPPKVWQGKTDSAELNLAILPKGVCATIVKDGELDLFAPTGSGVKRVEDPQIATDMLLANWGDVVVYVKNGEVWSLKLK